MDGDFIYNILVHGTVNIATWLSKCRVEYKTGVEAVSQKLCAMLTGIQTGCIEDNMGWTVEIDWACNPYIKFNNDGGDLALYNIEFFDSKKYIIEF